MNRRLPVDELFRRDGTAVGDDTLDLMITQDEQRLLRHADPVAAVLQAYAAGHLVPRADDPKSDAGYRAAVSEELLQAPEAITNRGEP